MSIARITLWLSVLVAVAGTCTRASAQFPTTTHQFGGAGFWEPDHMGLVNPQIPLNYFEPDFQFFAPADVDTFGGYPEPPIGFFFSYERLYWNVQRSETSGAPYEGDFTWGNRVDFGYMTENGHGWLVSAFHLDGPNEAVASTTIVQDSPLSNDTLTDDIVADVSIAETINLGRFEGAEVNKTFRWHPVGKNYIIEPMVGIRYMKFIDRLAGNSIVERDDEGFTGLRLDEPTLSVENNILGGQLGMRIHHQTERWVWAVEAKIMPAINWQFYPTQDFDEFTVFGQIRASSTYKLTRDISIGGGFDVMQFGQGIARGGQRGVVESHESLYVLPKNDQDVFIGGFSMMVQINR